MIPEFPTFKPLELSDREDIAKHTSKFVPYSDFNFTSLWSWDTDQKLKVSNLNQNLVVQFSDYISDEQFLSFIGTNEVNETMSHLLALAEIKGLLSTAKLVPSVVVEKLDTSRFIVEEDRDNFDYIYSVQGLTELKGSLFADIRNQKNRTEQRHSSVKLAFLDLNNADHINKIHTLFQEWTMNKEEKLEADKERLAIERLLVLSKSEKSTYSTLGIFDQDQLIAFAINEVLWGEYAISHFVKANVSYAGIYAFLMQAIAKSLLFQDCKYLNYEQDLGLENLRYAKMCFRPTQFLNKYKVRFKK